MRYIDAFNHFFPKRYYEALLGDAGGDEGPRQARARHSGVVRHRLAAAHRRVVRELHAASVPRPAADGAAVGSGQIAGDGEDRQRRPRRGRRQTSQALRRLVGAAADECAGGRGEGSRARAEERRQRRTDRNQRQRRSARRAAIPADLRGHRQIRQADPAASGAHARHAGLSDGEIFQIRNLQRARLALRDRRDAGAPRLLRNHGSPSAAQSDRAPSRRRHSLSRRARRAFVRSARRAHLG